MILYFDLFSFFRILFVYFLKKKKLFLFHSPILWIITEVGPTVVEKTKQTNPLTFEYITKQGVYKSAAELQYDLWGYTIFFVFNP